ncbi:MAG: winged helix-turn-helix domain-containing protein [Thermoplasmataceae archaeon]
MEDVVNRKSGVLIDRFSAESTGSERWMYIVAPTIRGKSGMLHRFDFIYSNVDGDGHIITCLIIPLKAKDTLSAITFFNAHSEDIAAYRKFIFFETKPTPEEKLLTTSLGIELFEVKPGYTSTISASLIKPKDAQKPVIPISTASTAVSSKYAFRNKKKYRDRTGLMYEVLTSVSANHGSSLSSIIFRCNLNYNSAKSIISDLIKREFLVTTRDDGEKETYHVSEHGWSFLEHMRFYNASKAEH